MHRPSPAIGAGLVLAREPYASEGPQCVVAQAEAEIVVRYGFLHDGERGLTAAMFDPPAGAFLVARAGAAGPPLGGVGLRTIDSASKPGLGEVRRLWVHPDQRGQGIARELMLALEDTGRDLGLTRLRLVTGGRQPEAVALYESSGWQPVDGDPAKVGFRFTKELVSTQ